MVGRRQLEIGWVSNEFFFGSAMAEISGNWLDLLWFFRVWYRLDWLIFFFFWFAMVVINCGFLGYCYGRDQQWFFLLLVWFFGLKLFYIRCNSPPLRFGEKVCSLSSLDGVSFSKTLKGGRVIAPLYYISLIGYMLKVKKWDIRWILK